MRESTFALEQELYKEGCRFIVGIDEAGRGPLAGPVVAAAVMLKNMEYRILNIESGGIFDKIQNSKALSKKQREEAEKIIREYFYVGVGMCDHATIDRINILQASFLAMKKALTELKNIVFSSCETSGAWKPILLVDGNKKIPAVTLEQREVVRGDEIVKSISAASIVAKVTRDAIMEKLGEKYPEYLFGRHKGYGTALHMQVLKKYGPCEIHRKSFRPVWQASRGVSSALAKKKEECYDNPC